MPRAPMLSESEKILSALHSDGVSVKKIAFKIGRSRKVVSAYIKSPNEYGSAKHPGRPKKFSEHDCRNVCRFE